MDLFCHFPSFSVNVISLAADLVINKSLVWSFAHLNIFFESSSHCIPSPQMRLGCVRVFWCCRTWGRKTVDFGVWQLGCQASPARKHLFGDGNVITWVEFGPMRLSSAPNPTLCPHVHLATDPPPSCHLPGLTPNPNPNTNRHLHPKRYLCQT